MLKNELSLQISIGVLSAFAVLWSAMETWSWSRRSGKIAIDPFTLAKLLLNTCGNLAHVFLVVVFATSLYWFSFFKQQNFLHVILPSEKQVRTPFFQKPNNAFLQATSQGPLIKEWLFNPHPHQQSSSLGNFS